MFDFHNISFRHIEAINNFLSPGIVISFATLIVAYLLVSTIRVFCANFDFISAYLAGASIGTGAEGTDTVLCSVGHIPRMQWSINIVSTMTFTVRVCIGLNHM